jgi:hypothetical protein
MHMAWVVTASLGRLMADFRTTFPAKSRASDGTIGDTAHQAETSGHNPDDTPGSKAEYSDADSKPEVRAIDVDNTLHDPRGVTMEQVVQRLLSTPADRDRLMYVIYFRRIWRKKNSWRQEAYTGSSPHTEHAHFSGDPDADENAAPWTSVLSFGDDMASAAEINASRNSFAITQLQEKYTVIAGDVDGGKPQEVTSALAAAIKRIDATVAALAARPALELTAEQTAALGERIAAAVVAHPDTPLSSADQPAIVEAVKTALREGLGA